MINMDLLPLGSVVKLKKSKNDTLTMIKDKYIKSDNIGRFVEYAGVVYPDGQFEDISIYFNSEDIKEVLFKGYISQTEIEYFNKLKMNLMANNITKIGLDELKEVIDKW